MQTLRPALMSVMLTTLLAATAAVGQTVSDSAAAAPAPSRAATPLPKQAVAPRGLPTAQQQRDSADATAASAIREERPVVPQLNIQLGRNNASSVILPASNVQTLRRNNVDDNVAQCEAQADSQERVTCRERLARSTGSTPIRSAN